MSSEFFSLYVALLFTAIVVCTCAYFIFSIVDARKDAKYRKRSNDIDIELQELRLESEKQWQKKHK